VCCAWLGAGERRGSRLDMDRHGRQVRMGGGSGRSEVEVEVDLEAVP
jgi:hypothetical protein